jgi:arylsulfatase
MGWDRYRELTLERQKKLGVVPPSTKLTARPESLPAWDSLNADQKRLYSRMMEVFAGFGAHVDYEMGRVLDAVAALPDADNTLVIYILGDNGASAEGGLDGAVNELAGFNGSFEPIASALKVVDELGGPKHYNHFRPAGPGPWTRRSSGPSRSLRTRRHAQSRSSISWPAKIKEKGGVRTQFHHVIDIMPTILEAPESRLPTRSTAWRRSRSRASAWSTASTTPRPQVAGRRRSSSWCRTGPCTRTGGWHLDRVPPLGRHSVGL